MSAWMCGAAHWSVLAARIAKHDERTPEELFTILAAENKASIDYRYSTGIAGDPDYMYDHADPFGGGYVAMPENWNADEIVTMAASYQYQSCEHDGWATSEAAWLIAELITRELDGSTVEEAMDRARDARLAAFPDYSTASVWGIGRNTQPLADVTDEEF